MRDSCGPTPTSTPSSIVSLELRRQPTFSPCVVVQSLFTWSGAPPGSSRRVLPPGKRPRCPSCPPEARASPVAPVKHPVTMTLAFGRRAVLGWRRVLLRPLQQRLSAQQQQPPPSSSSLYVWFMYINITFSRDGTGETGVLEGPGSPRFRVVSRESKCWLVDGVRHRRVSPPRLVTSEEEGRSSRSASA